MDISTTSIRDKSSVMQISTSTDFTSLQLSMKNAGSFMSSTNAMRVRTLACIFSPETPLSGQAAIAKLHANCSNGTYAGISDTPHKLATLGACKYGPCRCNRFLPLVRKPALWARYDVALTHMHNSTLFEGSYYMWFGDQDFDIGAKLMARSLAGESCIISSMLSGPMPGVLNTLWDIHVRPLKYDVKWFLAAYPNDETIQSTVAELVSSIITDKYSVEQLTAVYTDILRNAVTTINLRKSYYAAHCMAAVRKMSGNNRLPTDVAVLIAEYTYSFNFDYAAHLQCIEMKSKRYEREYKAEKDRQVRTKFISMRVDRIEAERAERAAILQSIKDKHTDARREYDALCNRVSPTPDELNRGRPGHEY
jgi:hypothetical protein